MKPSNLSHPTKRIPTAVEVFYADKSMAHAIDVAISDHRAYNNGSEIYEYTDVLRTARNIVAEVEELRETLLAALAVTQLNLPSGVTGKWPQGTDTPNGPDFGYIEAKIKAALVLLHFK
jgi:hypothetical protein